MRYKLLRNSTRDQRIWQGENNHLYLADHSGDHSGTCGTPDQTEDGPLRLLRFSGETADFPRFHATVLREKDGREACVSFHVDVAVWLADHLGRAVSIRHGRHVFALKATDP